MRPPYPFQRTEPRLFQQGQVWDENHTFRQATPLTHHQRQVGFVIGNHLRDNMDGDDL